MRTAGISAILVLVLGLVGTASAELPLGWRNADVGAPWPPGSASYNSTTGMWTVTGDGLDIVWFRDDFHYVYKRVRGDGQMTARVVSLTGASLHEWAKAGVMIREDLQPGSKFWYVMISGNNGCRCQERSATDAAAVSDTPVATSEQKAIRPPYWIKLVRQGNEFRAYYSSNPATDPWHELVWSPRTVEMTENVYIGLAVTSHNEGVLCTAKFDNITVEGETAMSTAFTYQGRLLDGASVADGLYDFQFKLYGDPYVAAVYQLGSTANIDNIDVIDGYFTVELDFGWSVFDGNDVWLEMAVRPGASTGAFTTLSPRQELTPTPYAIYAERAGEAVGGGSGGADNDWMVSGSNMYTIPSGNVGVGTSSPTAKLDVDGQVKIRGGSPGAGKVLTSDATGLATWQTPTGGGGPDGDWAVSGNNMYAMPSGNVGIGTTNPGGKLHVLGTFSGPQSELVVESASASMPNIAIKSATGSVEIGEAFGQMLFYTNGFLRMEIGHSGNVGINGKVGIGTESPTNLLSFGGSSPIISHSTSDGSDNASLGLCGGGGASVLRGACIQLFGNEHAAYPGDLHLSHGSVTGKVFVSGNVGIDTWSPSYPLDVAGAANLNKGKTGGALYVNGDEAIWYNGTYFSWGYGGSANYFADPVGIGTTSPPTKLAVTGLIGTASYSNLKYNPANGAIYYQTSSKRYKEDIQPLEDNFFKILEAQPRSFTDKTSQQREIGFIAEEFEKVGLGNLVIYNKDGQPDALKYEMVSLYLLEVVKDQVQTIRNQVEKAKDQAETIEQLKAENESFKQKNQSLEQRLDALETRMKRYESVFVKY